MVEFKNEAVRGNYYEHGFVCTFIFVKKTRAMEMIEISNSYAPEHLIISTKNKIEFLKQISHMFSQE